MTAQPTVTTAIRFPAEVKDRLKKVADTHTVSVNKLVNLAVVKFLAGLEQPSSVLIVPPRPPDPPKPDYGRNASLPSWRERRRMVRAYKKSIGPETH